MHAERAYRSADANLFGFDTAAASIACLEESSVNPAVHVSVCVHAHEIRMHTQARNERAAKSGRNNAAEWHAHKCT